MYVQCAHICDVRRMWVWREVYVSMTWDVCEYVRVCEAYVRCMWVCQYDTYVRRMYTCTVIIDYKDKDQPFIEIEILKKYVYKLLQKNFFVYKNQQMVLIIKLFSALREEKDSYMTHDLEFSLSLNCFICVG